MKQWFLGRGQTLLSLVIVVGCIWGLIGMMLRLPQDPANQNISAVQVAILGIIATLGTVAVGIGKSLTEKVSPTDKESVK